MDTATSKATVDKSKDDDMDLGGDVDNADADGDDDDVDDDDDTVDMAELMKALHKSSSGPPATVAVPKRARFSKGSNLRRHKASMPGLEVRQDLDDSDDDDDDADADVSEEEDDDVPPLSGLAKGTKPRMSVEQANANLSKANNYNWYENGVLKLTDLGKTFKTKKRRIFHAARVPDKFSSSTPGHDKKSAADIIIKNMPYGYKQLFPDKHWLKDRKIEDFLEIGLELFEEKEAWTKQPQPLQDRLFATRC